MTAILLATGWGTAAAASMTSVFVTNTSANPVPVSGAVTVSSASPLGVTETNRDGNGNIKVHEQGTVPVSGTVGVSNFPATQPVSGTVGVSNFPATQEVSGSVSINGTPFVDVGNFPSTQNVAGTVNVGNLPAAAQTADIQDVTPSNSAPTPPGGTYFLLDNQGFPRDISLYRSVTLYANFTLPSQTCVVMTRVPSSLAVSGDLVTLDSFTGTIGQLVVKTYDLPPPTMTVKCTNGSGVTSHPVTSMLAGRTG